MRYVERSLCRQVRKAARSIPALLLTGPRQSGKTTLPQHLFRDASIPVMLDEIQNAPQLLG